MKTSWIRKQSFFEIYTALNSPWTQQTNKSHIYSWYAWKFLIVDIIDIIYTEYWLFYNYLYHTILHGTASHKHRAKEAKKQKTLKRVLLNLIHYSKASPETSESAMIFNPKEISLDLSDGPSISHSRDKKEFYLAELKFHQSLLSSLELLIKTKLMCSSSSSKNTPLKIRNKEDQGWLKQPNSKPKVIDFFIYREKCW